MTAKSTRKPARAAPKTTGRSPAKRNTAKVAKVARKPAPPPLTVPEGSKQSQLIELLRSPGGGTIDQLTTLTGWQPHSVRGVISGALRKRLKLNVTCEKSVYRIVEAKA